MSIAPSHAQRQRIKDNAEKIFGNQNSYGLLCRQVHNEQYTVLLTLSDDTRLIHTRAFNTAQEAWDDLDTALQKEVDRRVQVRRDRILANCRAAWGVGGVYTVECKKDRDRGYG